MGLQKRAHDVCVNVCVFLHNLQHRVLTMEAAIVFKFQGQGGSETQSLAQTQLAPLRPENSILQIVF